MHRFRVVMVDDDAGFRKWLRLQLEPGGFVVEEAEAGQAGLALIRRAPPDVVVLDWRMPESSGVEVCRELRADPETVMLPVVLLTGLEDDRDRHTAWRAGVDAFVSKRSSGEQIVAVVRELAEHGRPTDFAAAPPT